MAVKNASIPHFPIEFEVIHKSGRDQKDAEFRNDHMACGFFFASPASPRYVVNPSDVISHSAAQRLYRDRPGSAWALAGLPEPSQGSPGRPRHRGHGPPSPEERATPSARTGAAERSILRHGVRAVESPVSVGRLVTPLWLVGPFGRSNGPCEGQRAVPMPVRLTRQSVWPGVQAGRRKA